MSDFKKTTTSILLLVFALLFSLSTAAYSGVLDTFEGYDFSTAGKYAIDSFTLNDDDFYVKIRIDDAFTWEGGGNAGVIVEAHRKNWLGAYVKVSEKSFIRSPYDTSYEYLSFTDMSSGEYKLYFRSYYAGTVDFSGTVYDNN